MAADDAGVGERVLHKEVVVPASRADVWRAWTTSEGLAEWWVKESKIECKVLGPYEMYLVPDAEEGKRGGESARVLSYIPLEMFSFEWTFPPKIPALRDAGAKTHVVLRFDELDDGNTRVRFDQLGWGVGEDWDAGYAYFDKAWSYVLDLLKSHFEAKSEHSDSWIDGAVNVTAKYGAHKEQVFEVELPTDIATAWNTLTTDEGVRSFLSPNPHIEMFAGGAYALFGESTAKVLGFVPQRQIVVTGSAPLEFPNVRMGGTWAVIDLEVDGDDATHVTMTCLGWQSGEEWEAAFDYFLQNNPVFLNLLRKRFTEGPLEWSDPGPGGTPTFTRTELK
ncbi:MAG: SRPBCC domain-containing protein [Phycisphaerales bacterium]|nr:SRPBCC domain-containing protein [Phycisphaerales bacterium]